MQAVEKLPRTPLAGADELTWSVRLEHPLDLLACQWVALVADNRGDHHHFAANRRDYLARADRDSGRRRTDWHRGNRRPNGAPPIGAAGIARLGIGVAVFASAAGKGIVAVPGSTGDVGVGENVGAAAIIGGGAAGSLQVKTRSPVGSIRGSRQLAQPESASAQQDTSQTRSLASASRAALVRSANMAPRGRAVR